MFETATDFVTTRFDFIEAVTVESLDPDSGDVLAAAPGVRALAGRETGGETPAAGGTVGVRKRNYTLVVADMPFTLKNRDRVTRADGTSWITGDVDTGGFGELAVCRDCVKER